MPFIFREEVIQRLWKIFSLDEDDQFFFQKFQEMMRQAYKREVLEQIEWADQMAGIGREKQKAFFAFALRMIREYFVFNLNKSNLVFLKSYEKEWGKQFAPFINERNIVAFFNEFELGIKHISMNGNPRTYLFGYSASNGEVDKAMRII